MEKITTESGIVLTYGAITVDHVKEHEYKKGMFQAQLRQTVEKTYPAARITNDKSDNIFDLEEFDIEEGETYESERVCWIPVPEGATKKSVQKRLDDIKEARIWREIADEVELVLTDGQLNAILSDDFEITKEDFEERYLVRDRNGEGLKDDDGNAIIIYSQNHFSTKAKEDEDYRKDKATARQEAIAEVFETVK